MLIGEWIFVILGIGMIGFIHFIDMFLMYLAIKEKDIIAGIGCSLITLVLLSFWLLAFGV